MSAEDKSGSQQSRETRTGLSDFATVPCGDSVSSDQGQDDDDLKEQKEEDQPWNMDTDEVEQDDEERQSTIWAQLEPSEANLNKLDGWGYSTKKSGSQGSTIAVEELNGDISHDIIQQDSQSEPEIDSLTSSAFETWLKENYVKHDEGKKPRVIINNFINSKL